MAISPTGRIAALASLVLLALASPAPARVISYAPLTSRSSLPAAQKRTNRHALLVEQVSVPGAPGPIGGPSIVLQTRSRLVVYDTKGLEEPRDVTPGGQPDFFNAAAFEDADGTLFLLANTSARLLPSDPSGTIRNLFSRDGGVTWTPVTGPPEAGLRSSFGPDVGGPFVRVLGADLRPGSSAAPFFLTAERWNVDHTEFELWAVRPDASASLLASGVSPIRTRMLGVDADGRRVLIVGQPGFPGSLTPRGVWTVGLDGSKTLLLPLPPNGTGFEFSDGWITPSGAAYLRADWAYDSIPTGFTGSHSVGFAAGGVLQEVASTSSPTPNDLFAVPTSDFAGAWVLQRETGPTILSLHTPAGGLVEAWRDVTRPEVEALHAAASGTRLLVQVHRPRPQVDQRIFRDPALAIWEVGQPAPSRYDELFLNETYLKGFVHLDVDAAAQGEAFVFDSGSYSTSILPPGMGGPSGGGGGDVIQEWGVVRGSLRQRLVIPASARTGGMFGAAWRTDLVLRNPDSDPVFVTASFLPNPDVAVPASESTITLPASSVVTLPDVLSTLFGLESGAGAILLAPEGNRSIEATSRAYTAGPGGSYGMSVPAVDAFAALGTNFPVSFSAALLGAGFRSSLVATDVSGRGASASLHLTGDSGSPDALDGTITAPASGQRQLVDLASVLGAPPWRTGSLLFTPRAGESIAGLIAIDNATNDPTWFPPDVPSTVPRTIPAIVHADGANGARFRTDLFLYNPSERTQSVTLAVKAWSANTSEQLLTLPLLPRESKTIRDILLSAFSLTGVARLRFQTAAPLDDSGGVRVTSRTYTVTPSGGTYGLLLPAFNSFQSAGGGEALEILLPAGGPLFRTNLALVDLSAAPATGTTSVKVEVFDELGVRRDVFETPLPLAGGVQIDDLFRNRGLGNGPQSGVIRISPSGGLVAAYATVIDNGTNDPLLAPPVLAAKP